MALVSFKTKVHKHRIIAQKKMAEEKSALSLSTLEEIPRGWFDVDSLGFDEVVEEEEDQEKSTQIVDVQKKKGTWIEWKQLCSNNTQQSGG